MVFANRNFKQVKSVMLDSAQFVFMIRGRLISVRWHKLPDSRWRVTVAHSLAPSTLQYDQPAKQEKLWHPNSTRAEKFAKDAMEEWKL